MDSPLDIPGLTRAAFEAAAGLGPGQSKNLGAVYRLALAEGRLPSPERDAASPALVRTARSLGGRFRLELPELVDLVEEEGEYGVTAKALLRLSDGARIECVRIPVPSRGHLVGPVPATLCISCQVGCRMGCAFCETGSCGFVRDLSAAEIVAQYVLARTRLGWDIGSIVFMGMGEPLDNRDAVFGALAVFLDPAGAGFAQESITLCTVGIPEGIAALRALGLKRLNLSVSLNAPDDGLRASIMPITRAHSLSSLASALRAYPLRRNFVLGVNYCLIPGLNDGPDAAQAIADFMAAAAAPGRSLLNLIPYNPGSDPLGRTPSDDEIEAFRARLLALGLHVRLRVPRGRGLMAGCGQLGARSGA